MEQASGARYTSGSLGRQFRPLGRLTGFGTVFPVSQLCYVVRSKVYDSHVRRGPARDPIPFDPDMGPSASTSHLSVMARWWIPAGGEVHLCCRL